MSLIQEALKRQQQDADEQQKSSHTPTETNKPAQPSPQVQAPSAPPPPPAAKQFKQPNISPPTPPTEPPPSHKKPMNLVSHEPTATPSHAVEPTKTDPRNKTEKNPWRKLIIVLLFLFLIIIAAAVIIFIALKELTGDQLGKAIAKYSEEIENVDNVEPKNVVPNTVKKQPKATKTKPKEISLVQKSTNKTSEQATTQTPVRAPLKWPTLKVTAALEKGGSGQAIINGKFITVGESIDGVKLVKISGNAVEFSYKYERKILKVGNSVQ